MKKLIIKRCGVTLVELIAALSTSLIIMSVIGNTLMVSINSLPIAEREYREQRSIRFAAEMVTKRIQSASAIFTIPVGKLSSTHLEAGWNYVGLSDDQTSLVNYLYDEDTEEHKTVTIVESVDDQYFEMIIGQRDADNPQLLDFVVRTIDSASNTVDKSVSSTAEALNALQIVDRGTASLPAYGFAYRTERRQSGGVVGNITFVIDVSGSMNNTLAGRSTSQDSEKRITKLENALLGYTKDGDTVEGMINELSRESSVELCLVPFSRTANTPFPQSWNYWGAVHNFYNPRNPEEKRALRSAASRLSNLVGGGTNTGDGMRRAYYRNMWFRDHVASLPGYGAGTTSKDYMIILVDGVTTLASSKGGKPKDRYFLADGGQSPITRYSRVRDWKKAGVIGLGDRAHPQTDRYVELIGERIKAAGITVYVIGFSQNKSDLSSVQDIADAAGATSEHVYTFTDDLDIDDVMSTIKDEIMRDLWHIRGPEF